MKGTIYAICAAVALCFSSTASATIHVVLADNFFYSPANLTIDEGDTVRFQWVAGNHPTSSTTGDWLAFVSFPLNSSAQTFDLIGLTAGTYDYICDFHVSLGMVGTITVNGPMGCDSSNPPTGLGSSPAGSGVMLSWNTFSGSVACQVNGGPSGGPTANLNVIGFELNSKLVPGGVLSSGTTYDWKVRCACQISPTIDASAFSSLASFVAPAPKEGLISEEDMIYPNPAQTTVVVQHQAEMAGVAEFRVIDLSGRVVLLHQQDVFEGANNVVLDASSLPAGQYMVDVEQGQDRKAMPLIIE